MDLYMRVKEILIGGRKFSGDDFTINFTVPFDDEEELNIAEVEIYNLSDTSLSLFKSKAPIVLNAGYKNDVGSILLGTVKTVSTKWKGLDKVTAIEILDDPDKWLNIPVKKTYREGTTNKEILNDLLALTGLSIGAFELPVIQSYPGGKTFNTKLSMAIKLMAKDGGAKLHINKGKIFIRPRSSGDRLGFVIDSDHGLIGSPEPIEKEIENEKTGEKITIEGWNVKTLLNHRISTDTIMKIKSKTANGVFRVSNGEHDGGGDSFFTEMEVFPV